MRGPSAVRVLAIASIGAVAAVAAHGGPALASDPRWLLPALAAALVCTWACVWGAALAGHGTAARPWSPWTTAGVLLAAQTAAHLALLGLGVMPATGHAGSAALHVVLAVAAAALWSLAERAFARRAAEARSAWLRFAGSGTPAPAWPGRRPQPALAWAPRHLRGPPRDSL